MQKLAKFLVLILVCFLFLGLGCKKKEETPADTAQVGTVLTLDEATVESTFLRNLETAQTKVNWDSGAKWVALNIQIDGNLRPDTVYQTYIFSLDPATNPANKYYYFTINFDETGKYLRALVNKEDYLAELSDGAKELNNEYIKVSWLEALNKAENSGGKTFREKYPDDTNIVLNLYRGEPNDYTYWYVSYQQKYGDDVTLIQIDANSGQIISSSEETQTDQNPELIPNLDNNI